MSKQDLTEYIFVDERRLNSYFEQISGPIAYDKVATWKAGLSLTGPSAEGMQARPGRPFTVHEKVQQTIGYLRSTDLVSYGRQSDPFAPYSSTKEQWFRIESMSARRALVPAPSDSPGVRGLAIWISLMPDDHPVDDGRIAEPDRVGALFLVEDLRCDENVYFGASGYSVLAQLASTLRSHENSLLQQGESTSAGVVSDDLPPRFGSDPIATLLELGAVLGPLRRITALYRVRAACLANEQGFAVTTIGYPVVITGEGGGLSA